VRLGEPQVSRAPIAATRATGRRWPDVCNTMRQVVMPARGAMARHSEQRAAMKRGHGIEFVGDRSAEAPS